MWRDPQLSALQQDGACVQSTMEIIWGERTAKQQQWFLLSENPHKELKLMPHWGRLIKPPVNCLSKINRLLQTILEYQMPRPPLLFLVHMLGIQSRKLPLYQARFNALTSLEKFWCVFCISFESRVVASWGSHPLALDIWWVFGISFRAQFTQDAELLATGICK